MTWSAVQHSFPCEGPRGGDRGQWVVADGENALLDLVEWVYWRHSQGALRILRQRIAFSRCSPTVFETALVKVAAKRLRVEPVKDFAAFLKSVESSNPSVEVERVDLTALAEMRENLARQSIENYSKSFGREFTNLQLAGKWVRTEADNLLRSNGRMLGTSALPLRVAQAPDVSASPVPPSKHLKNRAVVAALFDSQWRLLAASRNTNAVVRTRHAEINLLEYLRLGDVGERVSAARSKKGCENLSLTLIVSTQCCRMCAAAIVAAHWDGSLQVFYLSAEPALAGVRTALHGREIPLPG